MNLEVIRIIFVLIKGLWVGSLSRKSLLVFEIFFHGSDDEYMHMHVHVQVEKT